jgi:hypothetical protein
MSAAFDPGATRAIRHALALRAYQADAVRLDDPDVRGWHWLVASHNGLFAVAPGNWKRLIHGWFFGICRDGDALYLFENGGRTDRSANLGRLLRLHIADGQLIRPQVLAKGLDGNCHQVRVVDGLVCVVDTANQQILRFASDGRPVDVKRPFLPAPADDRSGAYLHLNSIARIGGRLALLLHNGKALPAKPSELAWLDDDWNVIERVPLAGHKCHDIAEDAAGVIWNAASMSGEIMASDGRRGLVSDSLMTRGIAFSGDAIAVGLSVFSARQQRDGLSGGVAILDQQLALRELLDLPGSPTDILALAD